MPTAARKNRPPPAFQPDHADAPSLAALHRQAEGCERCDLYKNATQLVFGEGRNDAVSYTHLTLPTTPYV